MKNEIIKILLETFLVGIYVSLLALSFTASVYYLIYSAEKLAKKDLNKEKSSLKDFAYFIISLSMLFFFVANGPKMTSKFIPEIIKHL